MKKENITRVSASEAGKIKGKTDWARVRALTDEEITEAVENDPDWADFGFWTAEDFKNAEIVRVKKPVSIRLDTDIVAFFKARGRGYQTRINNVLRRYVEEAYAREYSQKDSQSDT